MGSGAMVEVLRDLPGRRAQGAHLQLVADPWPNDR